MILLKKWKAFPVVHLIHGLKTALACVLAYAITQAFSLEFGYWAVISTVIVMQVYVADSVSLCLYRFSGTLLGAFLGLLVLYAFPPVPLWTATALFVSVAVCGFMTHYNTRYRMAAVTLVIILLSGDPGLSPLRFCMARVWEISIGIGCAFVVSVALFPSRKLDFLKEAIKHQATECCDRYDALIHAFLNRQQTVSADFLDTLEQSIRMNHEMLQDVIRHETLIYHREGADGMVATLTVLDRAVEHLRTMARTLATEAGPGYDIIMESELLELAQRTKETLVRFIADPKNVRGKALGQALRTAESRMAVLRAEGVTQRFNLSKLIQVFSFYHSMHYLAEDLLHAAGTGTNDRA